MVYPVHRFQAFAELTASERQLLSSLGDPEIVRRKGDVFQREGDEVAGFHLHTSGWIASSITLPSGKRLVQKIHLPGDMLGTPSMVLVHAADTLTAVTHATTAYVPYERFAKLYTQAPRVAALFTVAVQMERLSLMDTLAVQGTASAREQLARLLLDLHARLIPLGLVRDDGFELPLTQELVGDLLGLTNVHVNRILRSFEKAGLIARLGRRIELLDVLALRSLSPLPPRRPRFEPPWLPPASA